MGVKVRNNHFHERVFTLLKRISTVIRQEGESQNRCYKKSTPIFPKNEHFLPPDRYVCVLGGKKCLFVGKYGALFFLVTPVLRFVLLPYCRGFFVMVFLGFPFRGICAYQGSILLNKYQFWGGRM